MAAEFDLEKYLNISKRLDIDDLDWDGVRSHPLSADEARCLRYFIDIETYTIIYLKELLSTPAAYDPEITAFLGCWNYEEYFHGRALERFVNACGSEASLANKRTKESESLLNRVFVLGQTAFSKLMDWRFICVHMTWGALNELTTLTAYQQIVARTSHPILKEICKRIIKDERRHFSFYFNQARNRLADPFSRTITRFLVDRFWTIVGSGVKPPAEVDFLVKHLFSGEEGERSVAEMDRIMGALPGFEGFEGCRAMLRRHLPLAPGVAPATA